MITKDVVDRIADLSKLELTPQEIEQYSVQMGAIMAYFEELAEIDTKNVEPLITPTQFDQHVREDRAVKNLTVEQALQNAPDSNGFLFKVPPVV